MDSLPMDTKSLRAFLLFVLIFPIVSFAETRLDLHKMMKNAGKYPASAELRKQMAAESDIHAALLRCNADKRWDINDIEEFFAAARIDVGLKGTTTYLVFPTKYCPEFFGAHTVPFWLMRRAHDGTYETLFSDATDEIRILDTRSHRYRDISLKYGFDDPVVYRFDGEGY